MLILTCPAQLQRLEGALRRSLPLTLPVYGAVMNINRGNPAGLEVVVDAWPEFAWIRRCRVGSLTPAHVDLLNKTWRYGGNARSRQYLEELLRLFPNLCLRDGAGQPLSWALTDPFGAGTHGYTLPAHRRSGYMWTVMVLAARRAQARGFPAFGYTATWNQAMQRLQEELGHQRLPGLCSYILHNPSLKQA
ncbi:Glycine N-acyltransferase-like protein 3 [Amazona aestiva]|uniref:Glycine N-acyltransferase-like protein n=1 Tax=Amazona aestiva TaxID=12930 RepID=A0A0Q3NE11_AMAAE|nr:Glycine N-acyltransferase-like protein 3 [Amazona aestiva]